MLPGELIERLLPPERRIAAEPGHAIRKGDRDATLTSLAGRFRRQGASEAALLATLREENKLCVDEAGHPAPLPASFTNESQESVRDASVGAQETGSG